MISFMEKDDPNLRLPHDWYKYGFGPYSWRGVVVGNPIRGRFSDECVNMIDEVRDHEEWEKIEQFDMAADFGKRLKEMDKTVGFRYFWVFVRHPKWRLRESPWQQWTLVAEVVLEAGKQRLDKWNLMGRLGNKARKLITQCAAWMRPDIIYVKRPVYQCRFEPQDDFFRLLMPFLDPRTERDFLFELKNGDGTVELCTYFNGVCKILRANPKAFVDDVVKAYEKSSDGKENECLEFLLTNHPAELLHPYLCIRNWVDSSLQVGGFVAVSAHEDRFALFSVSVSIGSHNIDQCPINFPVLQFERIFYPSENGDFFAGKSFPKPDICGTLWSMCFLPNQPSKEHDTVLAINLNRRGASLNEQLLFGWNIKEHHLHYISQNVEVGPLAHNLIELPHLHGFAFLTRLGDVLLMDLQDARNPRCVYRTSLNSLPPPVEEIDAVEETCSVHDFSMDDEGLDNAGCALLKLRDHDPICIDDDGCNAKSSSRYVCSESWEPAQRYVCYDCAYG